MTEPKPRRTAGLRGDPGLLRAAGLLRVARLLRVAWHGVLSLGRRGGAGGPWRVAVREASMRPSIEPGDWLLVDPTTRRWPRRGSVVVLREPDSAVLAIKRIAAGPGDRVDLDEGHLVLRPDEAWLLSDATDADLLAAGLGQPIDSRRYGPVPLDCLVGRAWFRYAPLGRIGRIGHVRPEPGPAVSSMSGGRDG